jgi:hypothetical protein
MINFKNNFPSIHSNLVSISHLTHVLHDLSISCSWADHSNGTEDTKYIKPLGRSAQIFQKPNSHLTILGTRRVT